MQWYSSPNLQNQTKDAEDQYSTKPNTNIFIVHIN